MSCLAYNDDILTDNKGSCVICYEKLKKGQIDVTPPRFLDESETKCL